MAAHQALLDSRATAPVLLPVAMATVILATIIVVARSEFFTWLTSTTSNWRNSAS